MVKAVKIQLLVEATVELEDLTVGWTDAERDELHAGNKAARSRAIDSAYDKALEDSDHVEINSVVFISPSGKES